jgi:FkbM family methyltransferase
MHISRINWKRLIVSATCIAVLAFLAFFEGMSFGRTYERYRFIFGASRGEALRGAGAKILRLEKSYSQFAQDLWVRRGIASGKRNGFYVDVGSADGEAISNTKLLDNLGWKGVCIDPFPRNMAKRTCQVFRQPAYSESGKRLTLRAAGDLSGIESHLDPKSRASQAPTVEFVSATLDEILAKAHAPTYIDYMNLDVEGAEYEVLRGLSFDRYQVGSLTVEHNYETVRREAIHNLLAAKGYVRVRSWEVDDWYVHRNLAQRYQNFIGFCSSFTNCPY